MMLKTQNCCAKNTLLPFNLIKGNVKERNANAWKYWGKFLDNFLQNVYRTYRLQNRLTDIFKR